MIKNFAAYNDEPRDPETVKMNVIYIKGISGTGKTTRAWEEALKIGHRIYDYSPVMQEKWWEGYDLEPTIIIDDLRASHIKPGQLLKILDKFQCRVPYKGGFRQLPAINFIITSIFNPYEFWSEYSFNKDGSTKRATAIEPFAQFQRRIDTYIELTKIMDPKLIQMEKDLAQIKLDLKNGVTTTVKNWRIDLEVAAKIKAEVEEAREEAEAKAEEEAEIGHRKK
jgi:hypothetical protein